jgi:predicted small secreted protein
MKQIFLQILTIGLLFGSLGVLTGCNTTAGAGQDVSATGHAVTHAADEVKSKL